MTVGVVPDEEVAGVRGELFIGGEWRPAASGGSFAVEDPATREVLCEVADGGPDDALAALAAAEGARAEWAARPPRERSEILRAAFEAITEQGESLARLMTLEMGKPLDQSRAEVAYGAEFFRWFAEEAVRLDGRYSLAADGGSRVLTMKQPVGPSLLITPWNFPLAMGTRKIGPALAAGCTVVVKPAKQTPLTTLRLAAILAEAGVPAGVVNVITTSDAAGTVSPLFDDDRLRKVSFTGSTEVGRHLLRQASARVLRTSMELGGNAPLIVFEDADLEVAVEGALLAKMRNGGEACTAANRIFVAEPLADRFAARLAEAVAAMKVGRGLDEGVEVGPLIDAAQRDKVDGLVEDALGRGARALTGATRPDLAGYFYAPTVLDRVSADAALMGEEIFGPVAPVISFADEDEAVAAANHTSYGLVSYLFTTDLSRAFRVAEALETGMVGLNRGLVSNATAPFGGVKQSGLGREGGHEGIEEYLETKYLSMAM